MGMALAHVQRCALLKMYLRYLSFLFCFILAIKYTDKVKTLLEMTLQRIQLIYLGCVW